MTRKKNPQKCKIQKIKIHTSHKLLLTEPFLTISERTRLPRLKIIDLVSVISIICQRQTVHGYSKGSIANILETFYVVCVILDGHVLSIRCHKSISTHVQYLSAFGPIHH